MSEPAPKTPAATTSSAATAPPPARRKPRVSLAIATAFGLGYIAKAPGTFGSVAGVGLYVWTLYVFPLNPVPAVEVNLKIRLAWLGWTVLPIAIVLATVGVIAATSVAKFLGTKDPQIVVVDEVSGQYLTYLVALAAPNWKYLLLGFILFRVFDIWKPFPARQAESLPGGLGIMADDWIAGIYAGLALWVIRLIDGHLGFHLGL